MVITLCRRVYKRDAMVKHCKVGTIMGLYENWQYCVIFFLLTKVCIANTIFLSFLRRNDREYTRSRLFLGIHVLQEQTYNLMKRVVGIIPWYNWMFKFTFTVFIKLRIRYVITTTQFIVLCSILICVVSCWFFD